MCITNSARRRSLTLQVLPSHLSRPSPTALSDEAIAPKTAPTSSNSTKVKKSRRGPGASLTSRHDSVLVHQYHDHVTDLIVDPNAIKHKAKGGVTIPFPVKLHNMLDQIELDGLAHVVSWQPHGRCFVVHEPKEFVEHVMPRYFKQTKIASFQRQLNLYGFNRLTGGLDKGGYYHELFLRSNRSLAYDIHRIRIKGTGVRLPTDPDNEPNFYTLPPAVTTDTIPMKTMSSSPPPALPEISPFNSTSSALVNFDRRKNDWAHEYSQMIAQAKYEQARSRAENDILFFEGQPFHYLDLSSFIIPDANQSQQVTAQLKFADSDSTVVSESSSDNSEAYVPSFSSSNMDWDAPLAYPALQEHMRRSSFQYFAKDTTFIDSHQLEDDIDTFFQSFSMPVDMYHEKIEQMSEDDETTFGYLIEQAISQ